MSQLYIVYLDEFGHDGPFISHDHDIHNTHPVFGLGGFVIPANKVREFSHFFFKLKQNLFGKHEIPLARKKSRGKWDAVPAFQLGKEGFQTILCC